MMGPDNGKSRKQQVINLTIAGIVAQVGCLTLLIVLLAVLAGLWLDVRLGTRPWLTILLLVISVPVSLVAMLAVVRAGTAKIKPIPPKATKPLVKEADFGDDT